SVGVGVGGDVQPFGARAIDGGDDGRYLAPVGHAGGLEMEDFDRDVRFAADFECLVERADLVVAFVAHVGCVDSAVAGCHLGQRDQFFGGGVRCGRVLQRT